MKTLFVPAAIITALVIGVGALTAACGGSGDEQLALREYFQRLEVAFEDARRQSINLAMEGNPTEVPPGEPTPDLALEEPTLDESIERLRTFSLFMDEIAEGFANALANIDAPREIEAEHAALVGAVQSYPDVLDEFRGQLNEVESDADLHAIFFLGFGAGSAFEPACEALLSIANENGIRLMVRQLALTDFTFDDPC